MHPKLIITLLSKSYKDMIDIKNKVTFLKMVAVGVDKNYQQSSNIQGQLKKKVSKLKKIKIAEKVSVLLTGSYKEFEIKIDPSDSKHATMIKAALVVKR